MFGSNVEPKRKVKTIFAHQWVCPNGHGPNPYYWLTCPVCGQPRPDNEE